MMVNESASADGDCFVAGTPEDENERDHKPSVLSVYIEGLT